MKKKLTVLLCVCMLAAVLCACGANPKTEDAEPVQTEAPVTDQTTDPATEQTTDPAQDSTSDPVTDEAEADDVATNESVYVGSWYEKTAGRGRMEVTLSDTDVCFEVNWADSATKNFVWTFAGAENEAGVIYYSNGVKCVVEYDNDGNETKTILSEEEKGSVEVLEDGTLVWTETGETEAVHEFERG